MKIFIINLKRNPQRKIAMQEQIESLFKAYPSLREELEFIFFEAVDGRNPQDLIRFKEYLPKFRFLTYCGRGPGFMLDTEFACFASHLELWKKCVELDEGILILEDDFCFAERERESNFVQFISFLKTTTCEFVKSRARNDERYRHIEGKLYLCEKNFSFAAYAYYLKPSGALKWLKHLKKMYYPVDFYTDMFYIHGVLNYTYIDETLGIHMPEDEISAISTAKQKANLVSKIVRPFWKLYWHLRHHLYLFKAIFNYNRFL